MTDDLPQRTLTYHSDRKWLNERSLKVDAYLLRFHEKADWPIVTDLLFNQFPNEGKKLIENFDLPDNKKIDIFLDYFLDSPQVTWLTFADERMGKDATICYLLDLAREKYKDKYEVYPRIVTLGNIKIPYFVEDKDRYWSLKDIPSGTTKQEVWVYCSELEVMFPAREQQGSENRLYSMLAGTFAQNHQKIVGAVKLASKVDLNVIRGCNMKVFKYTNPEKLQMANVERGNVLSPLGRWLLPHSRHNKSATLLAFDDQLFTVDVPLPVWWDEDYSNQFRDISTEDQWSFVDATSEGMKAEAVLTTLRLKFRSKITRKEVDYYLKTGEIMKPPSL